MKRITMTIPFPGFYYSQLSEALDGEEEQLAEHLHDTGDYPGTLSDIGEALYWTTNYDQARRSLAQDYARAFAYLVNRDHVPDEVGLLDFRFDTMDSPREYNFTTDRCYVTLPFDHVKKMLERTPRNVLEEVIKERHTSRPGFISFYSNRGEEWLTKPLDEWDHNEVGTLLRAFLRAHGVDLASLEDDIVSDMFEGDSFGVALEDAVDFDALRERLEKQAA